MALTGKQKLFCECYVANRYNATQAYIEAYNSSRENAEKHSYKLMKNPEVKEYIVELEKDIFEARHITAERIATELAEMAFAKKEDDTYTPTVKLKALDLLQKQLSLQNQKIDVVANNTITIEIGE